MAKYTNLEKILLTLLYKHCKDALLQVKTDILARKALQMVPKTAQPGFSINNLWDNTFVQDNWNQLKAQQEQQQLAAAAAAGATKTLPAPTTPAPALAVKESWGEFFSRNFGSNDTRTVSSGASSSAPAIESTPVINVANITLEEICFDDLLLLDSDEPKITLSAQELNKDWTSEIDGADDFVRIGKNFIHDLQVHLQERNPDKNWPSHFLTGNLDNPNGPIPKFYYFLAKVIKGACNSIETMPLRSHFLLLLVKYSIQNIKKEKKLMSGWQQKNASKSLKAMLVTLHREHLDPMDTRVRSILANTHAPKLFSILNKKDEAVRAKIIELLFTLFYQDDNQRNKSKEVLEKAWESYQKTCKDAEKDQEDPPYISLIFLMSIMQIQVSKNILIDDDPTPKETQVGAQSSSSTSSSSSSAASVPTVADEDNYSTEDEEDDADDDNDEDDIDTHNDSIQDAIAPQETILVQKGKKQIPLQINPVNAMLAEKISPADEIKINAMIAQIFSVRSNSAEMNIGGKSLTAQQLVDWGLIDPESPYYKEKNIKVRLVPTKKNRERNYCALLDPVSGVPKVILDNEIKILQAIHDGDDANPNNLVIAHWQMIWSYYFHYCLNSEQIKLSEHKGDATGESGLFLIASGPTRAGIMLTKESIVQLSGGLKLLYDAVEALTDAIILAEEEIPEKWQAQLITGQKLIHEIMRDLEDEKFILSDLDVISEQWHISQDKKIREMNQLFDTHEEVVRRNIKIALREKLLSSSAAREINNLVESQDRFKSARMLEAMAKQMTADKRSVSSQMKQQLVDHGISGGRDPYTRDFTPGDVLDRDNLTLPERRQAIDNANSRAQARAALEAEILKLRRLQEQIDAQETNIRRLRNTTHSNHNSNHSSSSGTHRRMITQGYTPSTSTDGSMVSSEGGYNKKKTKQTKQFTFN